MRESAPGGFVFGAERFGIGGQRPLGSGVANGCDDSRSTSMDRGDACPCQDSGTAHATLVVRTGSVGSGPGKRHGAPERGARTAECVGPFPLRFLARQAVRPASEVYERRRALSCHASMLVRGQAAFAPARWLLLNGPTGRCRLRA
jgi:hypothetical protein